VLNAAFYTVKYVDGYCHLWLVFGVQSRAIVTFCAIGSTLLRLTADTLHSQVDCEYVEKRYGVGDSCAIGLKPLVVNTFKRTAGQH
jgi:hypothetical protein